jgi:hypothetical protein
LGLATRCCLTLPSPKERVLKEERSVKVLSFGEDLGEAKLPGEMIFKIHQPHLTQFNLINPIYFFISSILVILQAAFTGDEKKHSALYCTYHYPVFIKWSNN